MGFVFLLGFSAFLLATVAGYFSIYGLASIFSGWFWEIIAMGIAIEYGKLISISYIYRYSFLESRKSKTYGYIAIIGMMLITSAGIFGFLSQGYQQDTLGLKQQQQQIVLLTSEQEELIVFKNENILRKKQIDDDIASLPNNYITGRQRLLKSFGPELETIRTDIAAYTKQIGDKTMEISKLKQEKLVNEVHIGPIIFIAGAFGTNTDEAVKWLIFMLIFVFDPLAVWLTLATNKVLVYNAGGVQKHKRIEVEEKPQVKKPKKVKKKPAAKHKVRTTLPHDADTSSDRVPAHSLRNKK